MAHKLRVLVVRSWVDEIEGPLAALRDAGFDVEHERVDLEPGLWAALERGPWDVVVCDWKTPELNLSAVGRVVQEHGASIPIVVLDRVETLAEDVRRALLLRR